MVTIALRVTMVTIALRVSMEFYKYSAASLTASTEYIPVLNVWGKCFQNLELFLI